VATLLRTSLLAAAIAALTVPSAACGGDGGGPPTTASDDGNLLLNAGFEDGDAPWFSLNEEAAFAVSSDLGHSGEASALLRMRDPPEQTGAKVYYLIQEVTPDSFPEEVSGYYRVEHWQRGTPKQYLQFVVIAFGADNLPGGYPNHQIRYLLAGIDRAPFAISNAFFQFLNTAEPALGEWVPFKVNVADDFSRLWGAVPKDFEKIRVLFEVRWDDKSAGDGTAEADVYYDDLYVGGATPDGGGGE